MATHTPPARPRASMLDTASFDYDLPAAAIAQHPVPRGEARLLVLDATGPDRHRRTADLPSLLRPGDVVLVNDTKVIPARLRGRRRPGGGRVEVLLTERRDATTWSALVRAHRRTPAGTRIDLPEGVEAEVLRRYPDGLADIRFSRPLEPSLERLGETPLPPYIRRPVEPQDRERYQTVFARHPGAIAAPTAGLHFAAATLDELAARRITVAAVTLHVGLGTFRPVTTDRPEEHRMEAEAFCIPREAAAAVADARRRGGRVVAVGTTVVRALESNAAPGGVIEPGAGRTDLFIRPGYRFGAVDVLLTNFHLPRSTLLMLVSAFAGRERVLDAYREAIAAGYRFYSYGDAMLATRQRGA